MSDLIGLFNLLAPFFGDRCFAGSERRSDVHHSYSCLLA
jgi:hypothetical protein